MARALNRKLPGLAKVDPETGDNGCGGMEQLSSIALLLVVKLIVSEACLQESRISVKSKAFAVDDI